MNEPKELLEKSLQTSLSKAVDQLVQQLDQRMVPYFKSERRLPPRPENLKQRLLRPALAFAMLVVSLGVGFYWGNLRQPALGPQALHSDRPSMVLQSEEPATIALYRFSNLFDVDGFGLYSMSARTVQQPLKAETDAAASGQASTAESASPSGALALAPQATEQVEAALDQQISFQLSGVSERVASVGFSGKDIVVPAEDEIIRWSLHAAPETVGSALRNPVGVSIDATGRIFVTEHHPDGTLIAFEPGGEKTTIREGLNYPAGIAFAQDHSLYLAEQGRGRVLRFLPLDDRITPQSRVEVFATGFSGVLEPSPLNRPLLWGGPFALTVTESDELLVSDLAAGKTLIYSFNLAPQGNWWDWLIGHLN